VFSLTIFYLRAVERLYVCVIILSDTLTLKVDIVKQHLSPSTSFVNFIHNLKVEILPYTRVGTGKTNGFTKGTCISKRVCYSTNKTVTLSCNSMFICTCLLQMLICLTPPSW